VQATEQPATAVGEDALALLFAEQNEGHFVFDHTRGQWFRWDGQVWRPDADEYVLDCSRALIRSHKLGRIRTATSVERAARTDRRLARNHDSWNTDIYLLGTPGDVIDLRDGELLAPDAAYMINLSAGVRPAPQGALHPLWSQFLSEATCNDVDLQRYLRQRAGYWLTGDTSREDFDFFYGPGGNGKGVFLKTISTILGEYALVAPISQFMVTRHDEHLCELARLAHARLVIASEPEENRTWAVGKIKQLTGNEGRIAARHMHQNFFEFWPRFKLVFVGNTKPRIASVDEALVRRLNLIPFQYQPATRDERLTCRPTARFDQRSSRRPRGNTLTTRTRSRAGSPSDASSGRCTRWRSRISSPTGKSGARRPAKILKRTASLNAGWKSCRGCASLAGSTV